MRNTIFEEVSASRKNVQGVCVISVSLDRKQSLMHYSETKDRLVAKVTMGLPNMVSAARGILEKGFSVPGVRDGAFTTYPTFESNIVYALRFMVDCGVVGGNWIEFPVNSYTVRTKKTSHCQIEVDISYDKLISHPAEGEYSKLAPFRILSVDIECAGRKGHFPDAKFDPVIQIATLVTEQGSDKPIIRAVWTLDTCAPIVGADVLSFKAERGQRLGEALIEELVKIAKSKGWPKIRWITADDNYRARTLYDRVAQKTMWNTYEIVVE